MSRVLCRRGVARGALSRAFSADHLLDALKLHDSENVYVELDSGGWVCAAGGGGGARLCVAARLAPHPLCATVLLCGAAPTVRLRAAADLAPHAELLLWFADDALAALDMPFLTPRNVRARQHYVCHACAAPFDDPNPLKVHLFLSCAPFQPQRFWREVAARLQAPPPPGPPAPRAAGPLAPAQLEALATEWGRARGGHVCVYCGKMYSRRYGLKIHLRTHTGYRPLRCRHCMRAFGDPSNLNKHERLHAARSGAGPGQGPPGPAGPARYACPLCGRALARRRDLERHVRTHTHTHTQAAEQ
ncbi:hypothetical protein PYW07_014998 [Mythimna separata]|uniref:C2H2-type domain-containing protein n=1 Tax=Mythimna separata TaxID=271217 RepID=A0AAD7YWW4_MYTSE|nr:hypothetical protein PYW07_014998 [Mythimna separata]